VLLAFDDLGGPAVDRADQRRQPACVAGNWSSRRRWPARAMAALRAEVAILKD